MITGTALTARARSPSRRTTAAAAPASRRAPRSCPSRCSRRRARARRPTSPMRSAGPPTTEKVKEILAETAKKEGGGWDSKLGYGVIDAEAACSRASGGPNTLALLLAAGLVIVLVRSTKEKEIARGLLGLGTLAGASGFFFVRALSTTELPLQTLWGRA